MIPGEYLLGDGDIVANAGRRTVELTVANTADRPIQVGSHFHFFEANRALRFDRPQAFGMRLNIPAGTAVRFEPGDEKRVTLVELAGARRMFGLNALTEGGDREQALRRLAAWERSWSHADLDQATCVSSRPQGARYNEPANSATAVRRPLRPHRGRSRAPGRHGAADPHRARPHDARRRGEVRRRQGHPRRHGAVGAGHARRRRRSTRSSPTR